MPSLKITLDRHNGGIKVEGVGFEGGSCVPALDSLLNVLDMHSVNVVNKPELQQVLRTTTTQQQVRR